MLPVYLYVVEEILIHLKESGETPMEAALE